jgi:hypothetical protein
MASGVFESRGMHGLQRTETHGTSTTKGASKPSGTLSSPVRILRQSSAGELQLSFLRGSLGETDPMSGPKALRGGGGDCPKMTPAEQEAWARKCRREALKDSAWEFFMGVFMPVFVAVPMGYAIVWFWAKVFGWEF